MSNAIVCQKGWLACFLAGSSLRGRVAGLLGQVHYDRLLAGVLSRSRARCLDGTEAVTMRAARTIVLALIAVALVASTASASTQSRTSSDWFGGYTISPDWNAGDYPAGQGCRDIDTWHTGRAVGVVDYEFHLYVHFCWAESSNGYWRFTSIQIHTGLTHEDGNGGATAEYDGVYQKINNWDTCPVGASPGQKYETRGCFHIVRKAQITHHMPGLPGAVVAIGHAVVAVEIAADGSLPFWPYHNQSQF